MIKLKLRFGILLSIASLAFIYTPTTAQSSDYFTGSYINQETGLRFKITPKDESYTCTLTLQNKTYQFQAAITLGILNGEYQVQGNSIAVSFTRLFNKYMLISEGYTIPMEKINTDELENKNISPAGLEGSATTESDKNWLLTEDQVKPAGGMSLKDPYGNYQLQIPINWKVESSDPYPTLKHAGKPATITIIPHLFSSIDMVMSGLKDITDPDSNSELKIDAVKLKSDRFIARMFGRIKGQPTYIEYACIFSPFGGGIFINLNLEQETWNPEIRGLVQSMLATVSFFKPTTNSVIDAMHKRLNGRKLIFLKTDSYSTQRTDLDLSNDGTYQYKNETSRLSTGLSTLSYADKTTHQGKWKINLKGPQPVLLLCTENAEVYEYEIQSAGDSETSILVGGRKFYIQ